MSELTLQALCTVFNLGFPFDLVSFDPEAAGWIRCTK